MHAQKGRSGPRKNINEIKARPETDHAAKVVKFASNQGSSG